jgi:hypothetical protein
MSFGIIKEARRLLFPQASSLLADTDEVMILILAYHYS